MALQPLLTPGFPQKTPPSILLCLLLVSSFLLFLISEIHSSLVLAKNVYLYQFEVILDNHSEYNYVAVIFCYLLSIIRNAKLHISTQFFTYQKQMLIIQHFFSYRKKCLFCQL